MTNNLQWNIFPVLKKIFNNQLANNCIIKQIHSKLTTVSKPYIQSTFTNISTFVLVLFLLVTQIGGQTGNLISPALKQKIVLDDLLRTLGLDKEIKASAESTSYFTIQSTDPTGLGYKMSTSDTVGTENSNVKFTNATSINDQQRWYFETSTKLIKSAIPNKCLATNNNQVWSSIIIKTCNSTDNTQLWDTSGSVIKNLATNKCVNAAWSNVNGNYQNLWFDGRIAQLNDGCDNVNFNFVAVPNSSSSASSTSSISSSTNSSNSSSSTTSSSQFYTIQSTDNTGVGYKMTTADSTGTINSDIKFTNITSINDKQRWYFDPITKLIKSAILNRCLATNANQIYSNLVLKVCNNNDNTQLWDVTGNVIKNLATGNCAVASWTQNSVSQSWENKWFEGRTMGLDNGCGWGFKFVPTTNTNSQSSITSSITNSSATSNNLNSFLYNENGVDLKVEVACVDDGEVVNGQQSFSLVVKYTNNGD